MRFHAQKRGSDQHLVASWFWRAPWADCEWLETSAAPAPFWGRVGASITDGRGFELDAQAAAAMGIKPASAIADRVLHAPRM